MQTIKREWLFDAGMNALANMEAVPGEDDAHDVYDDAYCLAFDAILSECGDSDRAAEIASEVAMCIAQQ